VIASSSSRRRRTRSRPIGAFDEAALWFARAAPAFDPLATIAAVVGPREPVYSGPPAAAEEPQLEVWLARAAALIDAIHTTELSLVTQA
jgi:hypothetical protein